MTLPAAPAQRMAYDRDGSTPFGGLDGYAPDGPGGTCVKLTNSEPIGSGYGYTLSGLGDSQADACYYGLVFPEPRDIYAVFWQMNPQDLGTPPYSIFETSVDTTDGSDGTWVSQTGPNTDATEAFNPQSNTYGDNTNPYYRTDIVNDLFLSVPVTGVVGVRISSASSYVKTVQTLHVYGQPSSGQNPDSLRFWQPVTDAEVTGPQDFGDVAQGSDYSAPFRLRNISASLTAYNVILSAETLTDASPSLLSQILVSLDGATYTESVNVGNIPPSTTTNTIYVQSQVTASAQLGACEVRLTAVPSSWA